MALSRMHTAQSAGVKPAFGAGRPVRVSTRRAPLRVRAEVATEAPVGVEKALPALKAALDIEAIKGILPHRCGRAPAPARSAAPRRAR